MKRWRTDNVDLLYLIFFLFLFCVVKVFSIIFCQVGSTNFMIFLFLFKFFLRVEIPLLYFLLGRGGTLGDQMGYIYPTSNQVGFDTRPYTNQDSCVVGTKMLDLVGILLLGRLRRQTINSGINSGIALGNGA